MSIAVGAVVGAAGVAAYAMSGGNPRTVKDRVVLITGGGGGVGREAAMIFAKRGARVVLWDISEEGLATTKAGVEAAVQGAQVETMAVDISSRDKVYAAASRVQSLEWGTGKEQPVFALINNAGIVSGGIPILESNDEHVIKTFQVNTLAHFWTTKAFLPAMRAANDGHIVTVASVAGLVGSANLVDYSASKFGAIGFAESLRNELATDPATSNVFASLICPAHIKTPLFKGFKQPIIPSLEPEEVAEAFVTCIENKTAVKIMPGIINYVSLLPKAMLPVGLMDWINTTAGTNAGMKGHDAAHATEKLNAMKSKL